MFAALTAPWLVAAHTAIPSHESPLLYLPDAKLGVWVIGWGARALVTAPGRFFDGNIFHPLPGQLTGTEACLSSQLVAAPVYWATGNAVLAANVVVLLSYPLGAFALQRLAMRLGATPGAAWIGGLAFALGPLRVPASLQVLQYLNPFLPLAALALERLRDRPHARWAAVLAGVLVLAATSAFYLAAIVAVAAAVWTVLAFADARPGRWRFVVWAAVAAVGAAATAALLLAPYFARPDAGFHAEMVRASVRAMHDVHLRIVVDGASLVGVVPLALGAVGLLVGWWVAPRLTRYGVAMLAVGVLCMLGPTQPVGGRDVLLPLGLLDSTSIGLVRAPWRFAVLAGFGLALLVAVAGSLIGRRTGRLGIVGLALAMLATRGVELARSPLEHVRALDEDRAFYDAVATSTDDGGILELPVTRGSVTDELVPDHMIASTVHGRPLVLGYTGYPPPDRDGRFAALTRLPDQVALQQLVALGGLRWVVLAPRARWTSPILRDRIVALPMLEPVLEHDGWLLARVVPGRSAGPGPGGEVPARAERGSPTG